MPRHKNIIVFYTDQQRGDALGCAGNPLARTPNIDVLAERGVRYANHYSVNPVCMPSRAAFITGRYPQANGVLDNGIPLPARELTMPEVFRRNGYRTSCFGKAHLQTYKRHEGDTSMEGMGRWKSGELDNWKGPYYGFEQVALTVVHGEGSDGAYGLWRRTQFPNAPTGAEPGTQAFPQFACWKSRLPLEAHYNTWVTDLSVKFLEEVGETPFYLHVSFPDPHHPLTPPAPYHSMFDDVRFPLPHAVEGENERKPKPYREAMTGIPFPSDGGARFFPELTGEAYQRVVAHTYGMTTFVDDCVGRVQRTLECRGLLENTVIVYTSDHGDFLGDHHFLYKGQLPCRSLLRVPLIVADPAGTPGVVENAVSSVDVMPTLLDACGIEVPQGVQGVVLPKPGELPRREYAFAAGWSKASPDYLHYSIYTDDWRITVYPNLRDGELYDLREDPYEHRNLFHEPNYAEIRRDLAEELLYAVGAAEPPFPPVVTDW